MRRYIEGSLRHKYIKAETFPKVSVMRIHSFKGKTWIVMGPGLKYLGEEHSTFTEALTFANAHTKKLGL